MAYENLKKYKCGCCGNDNYNIYKQEDNEIEILAECTKCKSISVITLTIPKLSIEWGEKASGIMYVD